MNRTRTAMFWGGLAANAAALAWMQRVPHGNVLALEFAPTRAAAGDLLAKWPIASADDYVWRDFPYLATYWLPLSAAAWWAAERRGRPTRLLVTLPLVASALDVVENAFLLRQVAEVQRDGAAAYGESGTAWLAPATVVAATAKWLLVAGVVAYVVRAAVTRRQALTTAS